MKNILSIVTAAYNAEKYIDQMIESVLAQPKQVELIIVNDGSTDGTKAICEQYSIRYENIRLINTLNCGAGAARNVGLKNTRGEYVIYLDSDDLLFSNIIDESFIEYLEECLKNKIDIISTARTKIDMNLLGDCKITYPQEVFEIKAHLPELEFWSCLYRRNFLVENQIEFFEYKEQDIETAFRYRTFSKADKITVSPKYSFYLQRNNPASNMHTYNHYKLYRIKAMVYRALSEEAKNELKDVAYLKSVAVENIYLYFKYTKENGHENSEDWINCAQKVKECFYQCKLGILDFDKNDWKRNLKYIYEVVYLNVFFLKNQMTRLPKPKGYRLKMGEPKVEIDSKEKILARLARISDTCKMELSQAEK